MKIGTWNLDAKLSAKHLDFIREADCDVWLLTEVHPRFTIQGHYIEFTEARMMRDQCFAALLSRSPIKRTASPHPAAIAATIEGITYCSSVFPWASCGVDPNSPWKKKTKLEEKFRATVEAIVNFKSQGNFVWGGDWNQNLSGKWQNIGSSACRRHLEHALRELKLDIHTAALPGKRQNTYSIDHIALPETWRMRRAYRVQTYDLSDHDMYIVEAEPDELVNASFAAGSSENHLHD